MSLLSLVPDPTPFLEIQAPLILNAGSLTTLTGTLSEEAVVFIYEAWSTNLSKAYAEGLVVIPSCRF